MQVYTFRLFTFVLKILSLCLVDLCKPNFYPRYCFLCGNQHLSMLFANCPPFHRFHTLAQTIFPAYNHVRCLHDLYVWPSIRSLKRHTWATYCRRWRWDGSERNLKTEIYQVRQKNVWEPGEWRGWKSGEVVLCVLLLILKRRAYNCTTMSFQACFSLTMHLRMVNSQK